jgi:hypothetical protein
VKSPSDAKKKKWQSSPHPISDVRDWKNMGRLEVQPDFQRKEVWSAAARIMLIDTILREIPMPKIFVWNEMVKNSTHRRVIDGQQRVNAMLDFLDDKFSLDAPYHGEHEGKYFKDLPADVQERILQYSIDFNEALNFSDAEVREVYSRVNKYSMPLNKQELRQADYPGKFLNLAADLAVDDYLDESRIFTPANRRRMGDVEFVSELLAAMLEGPRDKKEDLDYFYIRYAEWAAGESNKIAKSFKGVLGDLKLLFPDKGLPLRETRFRQKADFYSLFLAIHEMKEGGHQLKGKDTSHLTGDLRILDKHIAPESKIGILSEYAIKCVSQANSQSSRSWRKNFLLNILSGTYRARKPTGTALHALTQLALQLQKEDDLPLFDHCMICGEDMRGHAGEKMLDWLSNAKTFQLSNAKWRGSRCKPSQ